jgi:hypothetical protein
MDNKIPKRKKVHWTLGRGARMKASESLKHLGPCCREVGYCGTGYLEGKGNCQRKCRFNEQFRRVMSRRTVEMAIFYVNLLDRW